MAEFPFNQAGIDELNRASIPEKVFATVMKSLDSARPLDQEIEADLEKFMSNDNDFGTLVVPIFSVLSKYFAFVFS